MKRRNLSGHGKLFAIISICLVLVALLPLKIFAQSGAKWATGGNSINNSEFFGTLNDAPIVFKTLNTEKMRLLSNGYLGIGVANPEAMLHVEGNIRFNLLSGTSNGLVITSTDGTLTRISFTGNNRHVLLGDGTFGNYADDDWTLSGNNIYMQQSGNVGIGTTTPEFKLDVNGDAKVRGELSVGDNIKINGITNEITADNGKLSFGNSNLLTEGFIQTDAIIPLSGTLDLGNANLTTTGSISADNFIFSGTPTFENLNVSNQLNTNSVTSTDELNINSEGNINLNTIGNINITEGKLGIGVNNPLEALDVNGNANVRGMLYVQDGVIIGQRMESDVIEVSEVIRAPIMEISEKLDVLEEINVHDKIKNNNLTIDGTNCSISSGTGQIIFNNSSLNGINNINVNNEINTNHLSTEAIVSPTSTIDFSDNTLTTSGEVAASAVSSEQIYTENLTVNGTLNAQNINAGTTIMDSIRILDNIKIGTGTLIISQDGNSIYANNGSLKLQCGINSYNTTINSGANSGNVGIGTTNPLKKLHVKTSELPVDPGEFGGTIRLEHEIVGVTTSSWDISPTAVTTTPANSNRLDFISNDNPSMPPVLSLQKDGKIGIGIKTPLAKLHVAGDVIINDLATGQVGLNKIIVSDNNGKLGTVNMPNLSDLCSTLSCNGNNVDFNTGIKKVSIGMLPSQSPLWGNGYIGFNATQNTSGIWDIRNDGVNNGASAIVAGVDGNLRFFTIATTSDGTNRSINDVDLLTNNARMIISNNGNIGIGMPYNSMPNAKLQVAGDIIINDLASGQAGLNKMIISDNNGKLSTQELSLSSLTSGNVGIGITTPTEIRPDADLFSGVTPKLEILTGTSNTPYEEVVTIRHNSVGNNDGQKKSLGLILKMSSEYKDPTYGWDESVKMGGMMLESTKAYSNNPSLFFLTNNKQQVELTSSGDFKVLNGKMGIGLASNTPIDAKLHIAGDVKIETVQDFTNTTETPSMLVYGSDHIIKKQSLPNFCSEINCDNGIVGIGSLNSQDYYDVSTLDGNIKLAIKGGVIATQFEVKLYDGSLGWNWPDYVFEKKYDLMPLTNLEQFIKNNKHLPEIPTVNEIRTNGYKLEEMDSKLLKKIEELTLYVIELKKENDALNAKIDNISKISE